MATDQVLESSAILLGRLLKLCVNDVWLANDMTYKKTKHTTITTKSVCIQCMVAHTVLLAVGVPISPAAQMRLPNRR